MLPMSEKLRIRTTEGGLEIIGNRDGLRGFAEVCLRLANLPEDKGEAAKMGNHYHFADYMNNLEEGSVALVILYDPDL
jgi:hypothetical protein